MGCIKKPKQFLLKLQLHPDNCQEKEQDENTSGDYQKDISSYITHTHREEILLINIYSKDLSIRKDGRETPTISMLLRTMEEFILSFPSYHELLHMNNFPPPLPELSLRVLYHGNGQLFEFCDIRIYHLV